MVEVENECDYKKVPHGELCGDEIIVYPDAGNGYTDLHMQWHARTIHILYTNVSLLILILYST